MPAAVEERMIRLWASPQGALKAAMAGAAPTGRDGAPTPARFSRTVSTTAGKTSVAWEGGKPVVTFPIPGVPGATATATLDAKYMAERVVVTGGSRERRRPSSPTATIRDWNNPLNQVEAFYAGKMRSAGTARSFAT